jgi:hypothetical protein
MRTYRIMKHTVLVAALAVMMSLPALSTQAADQSLEGAVIIASPGEPGMVAAGAVEDTLKACLARIPTDASAGQRMLAEQSCQQDEVTRTQTEAAPKF